MTDFTTTLSLSSQTMFAAGPTQPVLPSDDASLLSGVVVNQNQAKTESVAVNYSFIYQEFRLPHNYPRGTADQKVPPLSGLQVYVGVTSGYAAQASLDWRLDHYVPKYGWAP